MSKNKKRSRMSLNTIEAALRSNIPSALSCRGMAFVITR